MGQWDNKAHHQANQTTLPGSSAGSCIFFPIFSTNPSSPPLTASISRPCLLLTFSKIQKLYNPNSTPVTTILDPVAIAVTFAVTLHAPILLRIHADERRNQTRETV